MFDFLSQIEFRHPWLLALALSAVPVYWLARRGRGRLIFSSLSLLPSQASTWRTRLSWLPAVLLTVAVLLLAIAIAGPRVPNRDSRVRREGIAIMMVVDTSGSMRALDLSTETEERTRLDAVMQVFVDFVLGAEGLDGRQDDAVGVVGFASYADTRCPLTLDHSNVAMVARELEIVEDRRESATAIGDGLALAVERLRESPARSRVAILLTDGVNNAGVETPLGAAELARTQGIRVYTIGAGTTGMAPVRGRDPFTGREVLQAVPVEIDERTLEAIAETTGGDYFRATDADSLGEIYREIDRLERTELIETRYLQYDEHYGSVLAMGLLLASLAWLGLGTVFRRLP